MEVFFRLPLRVFITMTTTQFFILQTHYKHHINCSVTVKRKYTLFKIKGFTYQDIIKIIWSLADLSNITSNELKHMTYTVSLFNNN